MRPFTAFMMFVCLAFFTIMLIACFTGLSVKEKGKEETGNYSKDDNTHKQENEQ